MFKSIGTQHRSAVPAQRADGDIVHSQTIDQKEHTLACTCLAIIIATSSIAALPRHHGVRGAANTHRVGKGACVARVGDASGE